MSSRRGGAVNGAARGKVGPMPRWFVWSMGLLACDSTLSEEEFEAKLAEKVCSLYFHCKAEIDTEAMSFDDEDECRDFYVDFLHDGGCDFDAEQGRACLDAIDVNDCSGEGLEPPECDDVYVEPCSKAD